MFLIFNNMKLKIIFTVLVVGLLTVLACKKDKDDDPINNLPPYNPTPYTINTPSNLPAMNVPSFNPTTVEGVYLGRKLYYDKLLHPTGTSSCSSCHIQSQGFAVTGTNIIPHVNLGYQNKFLWNGEIQGTLEDAMMFEVETFFGTDVSRLQKDSLYPILFYKAFGSTTIDTKKCAYALAQFLRTVVSGNSKLDRFIRHEALFTPDEIQGFNIFFSEKGDCFHCHSLSLTSDGDLHNIGLDSVFTGVNAGYYNVSHNAADYGKFRTPSLRNTALKTTFMHDARFTTLDQVIEHYNTGVKHSPSLDPVMTKPGKELGLQLTPLEKQKLKAFLLTLTDSTFLTNPDFSNPN